MQLIVSEIDAGPSEINKVLEEIILTVLKDSDKRKEISDGETQQSSKKQKVDNENTITEINFHIGVYTGACFKKKTKRRINKKKKQKPKTSRKGSNSIP